MANYTTSPNMSLILPTVGQETGPLYATDQNTSLSIIDSHDHSIGRGVQITPAGLNINQDLSFLSNNATALRSVRFTPTAVSGALDLSCIFSNTTGDLYYRNASGASVQITNGSSVAGASGSIGNLSSPASATYVSGTPAFVFQSNTSTAANLDGGSLTIRKITASSPGITIAPPSALAANYTLTLPSTLPASTKILTVDASGNVGDAYDVDNCTLVISSNTIQIPSNVSLPGKAAKESGKNLVVSNTNATNSLAIVRGVFSYNGSVYTIVSGEGFSVANNAGNHVVTFTAAFADSPAVNASLVDGTIDYCYCANLTSSSVWISNSAGGNRTVSFTAIGQRA